MSRHLRVLLLSLCVAAVLCAKAASPKKKSTGLGITPCTRMHFEACLPGVEQKSCYKYPSAKECEREFCPQNCSGKGTCSNFECQCQPGYAGAYCKTVLCPDDCNGHGTCKADTGQCFCYAGFAGLACTIETCPNNCTDNGECDFSTGKCNCFHGFTGPSCSEEPGQLFIESYGLAFSICLVLVSTFVMYMLSHSRFRILPHSITTIFLGICIGGALRVVGLHSKWLIWVQPNTIFLFLLPLIIFDSGFCLDQDRFFRNMSTIMVFAVVGTFISALIIAGGFYYLESLHDVHLSLRDCCVLGALLSAVDPVATLAVFQALKVDKTLYMLVFGESVLNDAVSVVLFQETLSLMYYMREMPDHPTIYFSLHLAYVFVASSAMGIFLAVLNALLFKHVPFRFMRSPLLEVVLFMAFSYLSFVLPSSLSLSGILSTLFCGIFMAHYTMQNMSPSAQTVVQYAVRMMAFISETFLFAYLGLSVSSARFHYHFQLVCVGVLLCVLSRALQIYPLGFLVNQFRSFPVSLPHLSVMWLAGLRGGIAFALSLNVPGPYGDVIASTTLIIVLFTIVVFGGSTIPVVRLVKSVDSSRASDSAAGEDGQNYDVPGGTARSWIERLDERFFAPFLRIRADSETYEHIPEWHEHAHTETETEVEDDRNSRFTHVNGNAFKRVWSPSMDASTIR